MWKEVPNIESNNSFASAEDGLVRKSRVVGS